MTASSKASRHMGPIEWGMLLFLSLLWGGSFFFNRIAVAEVPTLIVVLARVSIAAVALNAIVVLSGHRMPRDRRTWGAFLVMGLINNIIPFSLIVWGQTRIAAGLASILNATTPLFAVLVAHVVTADEKLTASRLCGVLAGIAGVAIMIGPSALTGGGETVAKMAVLGAAVSYACASIWGRRFRALPPAVTAAGQVTASSLVVAPIALAAARPWTLPPPSPPVIGALLGLGLLSTAVGYFLYFAVLARAGATNVVLVTLLVPPSAILLGALFLGERLDGREVAGLLCIAAGLAAIDGRIPRRIRGWLMPRLAPAN
ncbi:MAG: DMT family transporter [Thermomicrobiales bacterium]